MSVTAGTVVSCSLYPDAQGTVVDGRETPHGMLLIAGITPNGLSAYVPVETLSAPTIEAA